MHGTPTTPSRNTPTVQIMAAVAAEEGVEEMALPPLANVIDPDALNELLDSMDDTEQTAARIQFEYYDYTVQITADQTIMID